MIYFLPMTCWVRAEDEWLLSCARFHFQTDCPSALGAMDRSMIQLLAQLMQKPISAIIVKIHRSTNNYLSEATLKC